MKPMFLARVCVVLGLLFLGSCGSDDEGGTGPGPPPPTPVIDVLSHTARAPGDTLGLGGRNFATVLTSNRVVFNNNLARVTPFFSNGDSLAVVVPAWANSGNLHVTSLGVASAPVPLEIQRGVGEPWVIAGGLAFDFKLASPAGTEEYVLIPYSASGGVQSNFTYTITPATAATFPAAPPIGRTEQAPPAKNFALEFELDIRRQAIDYIETYGAGKRPFDRVPAAPAPAPTRDFRVLTCTGCSTLDPANFKTITADLKYDAGKRVLIYADINQPANSFTQADYDAFGMQFDNQIFPTDSTFFGPTTDVNNDNRVAILFTPEVDKLTPPGTAQTEGFISGFFLLNDLVPNLVPAGTSNGMEIIYAMVPDPGNEFGNTFPKGFVTTKIPGTLAHELEHVISFGFRFFNFGSASLQVTWLEEGMAHMAEDLNGFDKSNIDRASIYLGDPGDVALINPNIDTLGQRGGNYLFLRYLGDQLGTGIYKSIVQSRCIGRACVGNVTGVDFFTSIAEFLATLYLSDRGITSDPKYNYASFDLQNDFNSLAVSARTIADGPISGNVRNATGDFYLMSGFQSPAAQFDITGAVGSATRVIVVRTQ